MWTPSPARPSCPCRHQSRVSETKKGSPGRGAAENEGRSLRRRHPDFTPLHTCQMDLVSPPRGPDGTSGSCISAHRRPSSRPGGPLADAGPLFVPRLSAAAWPGRPELRQLQGGFPDWYLLGGVLSSTGKYGSGLGQAEQGGDWSGLFIASGAGRRVSLHDFTVYT